MNRRKRLRFNLNPKLEREDCFVEDMKLLKLQSFCTVDALQSEIWCERFDAENPVQSHVPSEGEEIMKVKYLEEILMWKHKCVVLKTLTSLFSVSISQNTPHIVIVTLLKPLVQCALAQLGRVTSTKITWNWQ